MTDLYLLISHPPHGDDLDAKALAPLFGLTAMEARMRVNYAAPEIWAADEDVDEVRRKAGAFKEAGVRVRLVKGSMLAMIPPPDDLETFEFLPDRFAGRTKSGAQLGIPYGARVVIVSAAPADQPHLEHGGGEVRTGITSDVRNRFTGSRQSSMYAAMDDDSSDHANAFIDVFFVGKNAVKRVTIRANAVDYTGLGDTLESTERERQEAFILQMQGRFMHIDTDERLIGIPPPKPLAIGGRGMQAILGSIDEKLKAAPPADLQSRLIFLSVL